jgi:hypothetical protein
MRDIKLLKKNGGHSTMIQNLILKKYCHSLELM